MKVFLGNTHVGDIENSGDSKENARRSTALLKELGLHKEVTESFAIYLQAKAFATVAFDIKKKYLLRPPYKPEGAAPFVVNASFACELYLKAILSVFNQLEEGHSLNTLFKHLPNKAKDKVNKLCKELSKQYQVEESVLFKNHLKKMNDAFTKYRYIFEKEEESINTSEVLFPLKVLELIAGEYVKEHNNACQYKS